MVLTSDLISHRLALRDLSSAPFELACMREKLLKRNLKNIYNSAQTKTKLLTVVGTVDENLGSALPHN